MLTQKFYLKRFAILGLHNEANDNNDLLSETNTKYQYSNSQFNKSKEKGEPNKHWYHQ